MQVSATEESTSPDPTRDAHTEVGALTASHRTYDSEKRSDMGEALLSGEAAPARPCSSDGSRPPVPSSAAKYVPAVLAPHDRESDAEEGAAGNAVAYKATFSQRP